MWIYPELRRSEHEFSQIETDWSILEVLNYD